MNIYLSNSLFIKYLRWLLAVVFPLFFFNTGQAEQLSFSRNKVEQGYHFQYQWHDYNAEVRAMNFILSNDGLFERFRNFKNYQSSYAQKTIFRRIKKHIQKNPISGVKIVYRQKKDKLHIDVKSADKAKVMKTYKMLEDIEQVVTEQYLQESYYELFIDHQQNTGIKVNHVNIANESVADLKPLKPLILEHVSIQNIRKATDYVLGFVQSIPYSTLESRLTSSGAGFNTPLKLLWENQGDCDSKMTLTAALLRALMPRIKMALVFVDNHAFIGINEPGKAGEVTIVHNNISYLLGEPTGPSILPLGKLSAESELAINQGHYTVQEFHMIDDGEALTEEALEEALAK